nr:MAG TPA: hypothetical protein [Bacteriophage sp.]DAY27348.1 MAG TPA: hypothetical protein [Caudoviricetes sp.]
MMLSLRPSMGSQVMTSLIRSKTKVCLLSKISSGLDCKTISPRCKEYYP